MCSRRIPKILDRQDSGSVMRELAVLLTQLFHDIITNICKVTSKKGSAEIKSLVKELNEWYNKIISLGGEKYAEILL